jgi:uncharacterized protein YaiL (DUF2058 family)
LAHQNTLLLAEVHTLRKANEALSKRRRAKNNRIRQGGTLTIEDAYNILTQEEVDAQIQRDRRSGGIGRNEGQSTIRYYSTYGKTGHNARTCQEAIETSSPSDSE